MQDRPESGRVYALTGGPGARCIANGDTWQGSEVFCGGLRDNRSGRVITHAHELALTLGCTPHKCGLGTVKA